ncbi:hypothetical protein [Agromyces seonyuensis]|uniref:Uncharacterized protein n=1 Tax=Agromyces seonyuensis TaxID=2662446 RepID=A0A6I4NY04_9MICO|nr:hypothetical protein [Agromyces seonyuensis]MWB99138.1 hypothetical protein [Agromyces seonyuensis]
MRRPGRLTRRQDRCGDVASARLTRRRGLRARAAAVGAAVAAALEGVDAPPVLAVLAPDGAVDVIPQHD